MLRFFNFLPKFLSLTVDLSDFPMWFLFLCVEMQIIKQKNGRSRGFAFVTMTTGEEAQAAIDKFNSLVCPFSLLSFCVCLSFICFSFFQLLLFVFCLRFDFLTSDGA
jgi:RNA recognition motif-containing protein